MPCTCGNAAPSADRRGSAPGRLWLCAGLLVLLGTAACERREGPGPEHDAQPLPPTPAEFIEGEQLYDANCARCHGMYGRGTNLGPPLVHRIYEPSHHDDVAFQLAVRSGVIAHHWRFGNMPPIPTVSPEQVDQIIGYVRWMQRHAGIE